MIADHILELAHASQAVLNSIPDDSVQKGSLRSAFILNLIAYEEAGKLFMMWQAMADAEAKSSDRIRIEDFEYHETKGDLAGDLCCQMLDFAEGEFEKMIEFVRTIGPIMVPPPEPEVAQILSVLKIAVSTHKERVYRIRRHFRQEREDAMYIDFRNGDWIPPPQYSHQMLAMDCILLQIIASATNAYLAEGLEFGMAMKAVSDLSKHIKSDESDRFLAVLQKRDPRWFGLLKGSPPRNGPPG